MESGPKEENTFSGLDLVISAVVRLSGLRHKTWFLSSGTIIKTETPGRNHKIRNHQLHVSAHWQIPNSQPRASLVAIPWFP